MKRRKKGNRLLSLLLACLMIVMTPASAFAFDADAFGSGEVFFDAGSAEDSAVMDIFSDGSADGTGPADSRISSVKILRDLPEEEILYTVGAPAAPLEVEAEGAAAFQWMRSEDGEWFELIQDAEKAAYVPGTDAAGTVFYKVSITGTDGSAAESKIAVVTVREEDAAVPDAEESSDAADSENADTVVNGTESEAGIPSVSDETGTEAGETPSVSDETGAEAGEAPSDSDETGAESEETPSVSDETGAESEETPSVSDETEAESEETPSVSDETEAEAEETPSVSDETGAEDTDASVEENGGADGTLDEAEESEEFVVTEDTQEDASATLEDAGETEEILFEEEEAGGDAVLTAEADAQETSAKPVFETNLSTSVTYENFSDAKENPLKVVVKATEGTLTYQWYDATDSKNVVAIDGANQDTYIPEPAEGGTYKYYVIVTNTETGKAPAERKSNTCYVYMARSAEPVIEENVQDGYGYKPGDKASPMTVKASSPSGGTLSYQWCEIRENTQVPIEGETGPSYTPDISEAGTRRYRLRITNTDVDKDGRQKAPTTITSRVAYVTVSDYALELGEGDNYPRDYPEEMNVTLPWSEESLGQRFGAFILNPYYSVDSNIEIVGEWFAGSTKNFADAASVGEGKASNLGTYDDEGNHFTVKDLSYELPATTKTGTCYYFLKASIRYGEEEKNSRVFGPYALTVTAPQSMEYGVIVGEDPLGMVNLRISDTTPKRFDLMDNVGALIDDVGPAGYFLGTSRSSVSVPLYPSDNMMTVVARTCIGWGLSQEGAEENYITKITRLSDGTSREEFQRGHGSGWMGSLNDWFTNEGFQAYTVAKGDLKAGDNIEVVYTTDLGTDVGAGVYEADDYSLKALDVQGTYISDSRWFSQLQPAFDSSRYAYTAYTSRGKMRVTATALTKQNKVHIYVDGKEYKQNEVFESSPGMVIEVVCGSPKWVYGSEDPENEKLAKVYRVYVMPGSLSGLSAFSIAENGSGDPVRLGRTFSTNEGALWGSRNPPYNYVTFNVGDYSADPSANPAKVKFVLEDKEGSEVLSASLEPVDEPSAAREFQKEDGSFSLLVEEPYLLSTGKRDYLLRVDKREETGVVNYCVYLRISKTAYALSKLELEGNPKFGDTMLNGAPEGTLFQLDKNGKETGETGLAQHVYQYNLYALPGLSAVYPDGAAGLLVGSLLDNINYVKTALYVDDREVWNGQAISSLSSDWYKADPPLVPITKDRTVIRIHHECTTGEKPAVDYVINVIQQEYDVQDLIDLIEALPNVESLEYARDYGRVNACRIIYDGLTEEQKAHMAELSPEAADKLEKAEKLLLAQKTEGEKRIQEVAELTETYKDLGWTTDTVFTEDLYTKHKDNIRGSWEKFSALNGWVKEEFEAKYTGYGNSITLAMKLLNRYETAAGLVGEKAFNYEDDFMVSSNAYNLTLGAGVKDYPITFRDIMYSTGRNEGSPYNSPGTLKWEIEDESIVTIRTETGIYKDMGLGSGGEYKDEKYYLIPLKAGTTTLTVNKSSSASPYYGQIPKIIIHVNSPEDAALSDADQKLTNIYEIPYTRKYDTWHYLEGTEGAPFTFHVNGENPKVTVWPVGSTGEKKEYAVGEDGNVTVFLKDGYNPIEVTAEIDGKPITQVYGLRGKAIRISVENKYRTGQPLVKGDTAVIKLVGLNTPVHKILRIYNPWGGVIWTYNTTSLPGQGSVRATVSAGQYGSGYMELLLTGSGTVKLTNGHIEEEWLGSGLYAEADQGNTGGIAAQAVNNFSVLPDIILEVGENEGYQVPECRIHTQISGEGLLKSGDTVTMELPDLPLQEIGDAYPFVTSDKSRQFQSAQVYFTTDIPGLPEITSEKMTNPNSQVPAETGLAGLKNVVFTIPKDTPTGTYKITGGHVYVRYGDASFTISKIRLFRQEIEDQEIQVVNPEYGKHDCVLYGEQKTTDPTCTEAGARENVCALCGHVIESEPIPALGHAWGEWKSVSEATEEAREQQERECSVCGEKETRDYGLRLLGTVKLEKAEAESFDRITVTWKKLEDIDGYYVYRKRAGAAAWKLLAKTDASAVSYTDTDLVPNAEYSYTVRAYRGAEEGGYDETGVSAGTTVAKVKLVSASAVSYTEVTVKWEPAEGADGYRVLRKNSSGGWTMLKDVTGTSYSDKKVSLNTKYTYTVRAFRKVDGGKYLSPEFDEKGVSAKPVLGTAKLVSAKANSYKKITVTWEKVTGATGYYVCRRTGDEKWKRIADVTKTSYADTKVTSGIKYIYTIRAYRTVNGKKIISAKYQSPGLSATPRLAKVGIKSVMASANHSNTIKWTAVSGATGYQVYCKTAGGKYVKVGSVRNGKTSFVHKGLKKGTKYSYKVRAFRLTATKPKDRYSYGPFGGEKVLTAK